MIDYDEKNDEITSEESSSIEKIASSDAEDVPSGINKEAKETYGAIYEPGTDGKSYSCKHYTSDTDTALAETAEEKDQIKSEKRKKSGKLGKTISIVAVALIATIILSSASAFAAAYLTKNYYENLYDSSDSGIGVNRPAAPEDNQVFIDRTGPSYITQTQSPGELMTMEQAIDAVKDSVVEITTEAVQSGFSGYSQYVVSGAGSGVIISSGGYIITNNHVIDGASNITVRLTNGREYAATLVATDSKTDIAVISITPDEGTVLTTAIIGNSSALDLGQTVIAIGNPLGKLGGTVTNGIISSLAREIVVDGSGTMTLLQTNAAVSPGNSGGGLFDLYGRLIGIVNAKSTGEGVEGISFAIPIDTAWDIAQQLIEKGYVSGRPALGVSVEQIRYGVSIFGESFYQLVVSDADEDSQFKVNDIIYSIDDIEVGTLADISDIIYSHEIGDTVKITVRRDKRFIDLEVTLIEYSPSLSEGSQS